MVAFKRQRVKRLAHYIRNECLVPRAIIFCRHTRSSYDCSCYFVKYFFFKLKLVRVCVVMISFIIALSCLVSLFRRPSPSTLSSSRLCCICDNFTNVNYLRSTHLYSGFFVSRFQMCSRYNLCGHHQKYSSHICFAFFFVLSRYSDFVMWELICCFFFCL